MQKVRLFFRSFGHYVLAFLCALVILLSALWTRSDQLKGQPETPAHADGSQRLRDVTPSPAPVLFCRPAEGPILCSFSDQPVYFPAMCCWGYHFSTDIAAEKGEAVKAAFDGHIRWDGDALWLENERFSLLYRGAESENRTSRPVKEGVTIGRSAGYVPWEGAGRLCLTLYCDGKNVDIEEYWE